MNEIIPSIIRHPGELAQFPLNANSHPPAQVDELAASRERFSQYRNVVGWTCPADIETQTVDGKLVHLKRGIMYVIAGNGFHQASIKRGDEAIEVKDYSRLTLDEAILLAETDNAAPLGAQRLLVQLQANLERVQGLHQDDERLSRMFERLKAQVGIGGNGHDAPPESAPIIDKAEELQKVWQVQAGDIWQLGPHRIICGDCREPETWQRLLGAAKADKINGVFTSPPYAEQRKAQYGGVPMAEYVQWWEAIQGNVRGWLAGDGSFFVNIKPHCEDGQRVLYVFDLVLAMVKVWGWRFVDELCWKRASAPSSTDERLRNEFEPVFHFSTGKIKARLENVSYVSSETNSGNGQMSRSGSGFNIAHWKAGMIAKPSNVLTINHNNDAAELGQPATFPVALPTFFIKAYSDSDDLWLDPFAGSGTTLIAAHNENRIGFGIERLEKYCSVICQRFLDSTGIEPKRVG